MTLYVLSRGYSAIVLHNKKGGVFVLDIQHGLTSPRWRGNRRQYQIEAKITWEFETGRSLQRWSWISTECNIFQCLDVDCMIIHTPIHIQYPPLTCVYCGEGCSGVDHLLPEPWTGLIHRALVAIVPACGNCNSRIGDYPIPNVTERRQVAQLSIERSHRHLLLRPIYTPEDLDDLGYALRSVAENNNIKALRIKAKLGWPVDPYYDIRAFQKSGIEDPESLGLCEMYSGPLRDEYAEFAVASDEYI
jgi:hypothetical protein